ncbi:hypothetical protein CEXT_637141 [Caerostris extrusa]|uniref:Uncharacterized protein n=1 Tax=Caerostris extrusa TaxID=172846 RepID=A0AAV4TDF4_CAEEX|nr:hypothetical protein CEXT_637141 [Caerostris extrusa]
MPHTFHQAVRLSSFFDLSSRDFIKCIDYRCLAPFIEQSDNLLRLILSTFHQVYRLSMPHTFHQAVEDKTREDNLERISRRRLSSSSTYPLEVSPSNPIIDAKHLRLPQTLSEQRLQRMLLAKMEPHRHLN